MDLEAEQAKRTQKARERIWDIAEPAPGHFRDVHRWKVLDDEGDLAHLHLHWCWYKQADSPRVSPRIDLDTAHEDKHA